MAIINIHSSLCRQAGALLALSATACMPAVSAMTAEVPVPQYQKGPKAYASPLAVKAFSAVEETGFTGIMAIAIDGEEPAFRYFGEDPTNIDPARLIVDSGSITKTVTAILILQLVAEGRLALTDELGDLFPGVPADKKSISVHQLLTHSTGFPAAIGRDDEVIERDAYVQRALATDLKHLPGTVYAYSNVGYSLLAAIAELKTGQPYDRLLEQKISPHLQGATIGYQNVSDSLPSLKTEDGTGLRDASWGGKKPYWNLIGNGGLLVSAQAMVNLNRALGRGHLISSQLLAQARTTHIREAPGVESFYGYGQVVQKHPELGRLFWHNGGNEHFMANWTDYPDSRLFLFAASNGKLVNADDAIVIATRAIKPDIVRRGASSSLIEPHRHRTAAIGRQTIFGL